MRPTVVTVLRSGGEFLPEHAVALHVAIYKHWPVRESLLQVCLTDMAMEPRHLMEQVPLAYGYPGWWSKMELFSPPNNALGDILYFDLDTVVVGDLTDIAATRTLTLLEDFFRAPHLQSAFMYLPLEDRAAVWARWMEKLPEVWMRKFRGDQDFYGPPWESKAETWQTLLPGQAISYKKHVRGCGVPKDARVVCFHGRPRPWHLKEGLVTA